MSDSSDDDFGMGDHKFTSRTKGKGKSTATAKKGTTSFMSTLDKLVEESKRDAMRSEKVSAILDLGDDIVEKDLQRTDEQKARTAATEAKDKADHKAILEDMSIKVPGAIHVFRRLQAEAPDLGFSLTSSTGELSTLSEAVKRAESDPADLEDLLRGGLVPWTRQKLNGRAPPDVCRWLMGLVAQHEKGAVVVAAEEALLQLLAEDENVWRLRYQDVNDMWRGCGAVWLATTGGDGAMLVEDEEEKEKGGGTEEEDGDASDGSDDEDDEEAEATKVHLQRNLRSALNVVGACFRRGAYELNPAELRELLLDLVAASLDKGVSGSCQTEVDRALTAVVDAMSPGQFQDAEAFSSLVDRLCDPAARGLKSRMTALSWALLAINVPFKRASSLLLPSPSGSGIAVPAAAAATGPSLRHEVCHRLLKERFLSGTSYMDTQLPPEGLGRALKALRVVLDNEDDLLKNERESGYRRQYVVVALANQMAAGSVVVSKTCKPDAEESKEMVHLSEAINKKLTNVMQGTVQMSKTLLDLTKSKYTPFLPATTARQSKLSFGQTKCGDESGEDSDEEEGEQE